MTLVICVCARVVILIVRIKFVRRREKKNHWVNAHFIYFSCVCVFDFLIASSNLLYEFMEAKENHQNYKLAKLFLSFFLCFFFSFMFDLWSNVNAMLYLCYKTILCFFRSFYSKAPTTHKLLHTHCLSVEAIRVQSVWQGSLPFFHQNTDTHLHILFFFSSVFE